MTPVAARLHAVLGILLEYQLQDRDQPPIHQYLTSPWDLWWISLRSGLSATDLGVQPGRYGDGRCQCVAQVTQLVRHAATHGPIPTAGRPCSCLLTWAVTMHQIAEPSRPFAWPATRIAVALLKPGSDIDRIRTLLEHTYLVTDILDRTLTTVDVRWLYPDAFGAAYVARQDTYLTSGPTSILCLATHDRHGAHTRHIQESIRDGLGATDHVRNQIYMPTSPGEIFAALVRFWSARWLIDTYEAHERGHSSERIRVCRDILETWTREQRRFETMN